MPEVLESISWPTNPLQTSFQVVAIRTREEMLSEEQEIWDADVMLGEWAIWSHYEYGEELDAYEDLEDFARVMFGRFAHRLRDLLGPSPLGRRS